MTNKFEDRPSIPSTESSYPMVKGSHLPRVWKVGTLTYSMGGLCVLFFWLLWGDFAWSLKERSVPGVAQLLFQKHGATDALIGLLLVSLPAALAMIIGPIISYRSDRFRSRWGRRIPFLIIPAPIAVAAMIGMAYSPQIAFYIESVLRIHYFGLSVSTLILLGIFWTLFEFASIIANSVFGGLINDVVPQEVMGRFFGLFRALSLTAGIVFNYSVFGHAETHYQWIFIGVAAIYGFGFTAMCLKVKEGDYPQLDKSEANIGFLSATWVYFRECFGSSYYLLFFGAMALAGISVGPVNAFSLLYAKSMGMSMDSYGKCLAATYTVSLILAYPLGMLADRFHPLRVTVFTMALYALAMVLSGLYVKSVTGFAVALIAHGVLSGVYFTASASIGQRLLPKVRFAEMASAGSIVSCLASIALAPAVGFLLDSTGHAYRYTFYVGAGLSMLALAALVLLHDRFVSLGGVDGYRAPDLI